MRLKGRSKYHALPTMVDGIKFASKKEATRYRELLLLVRAGHIRRLKLQPAFELLVVPQSPIVASTGKPVHVGRYLGDFSYDERLENHGSAADVWRFVVEDVKGFKTPVYRLKKRIVEAVYGIEIREI